jgi:hypothetical protein
MRRQPHYQLGDSQSEGTRRPSQPCGYAFAAIRAIGGCNRSVTTIDPSVPQIFRLIERLANYLIVKGEIRREANFGNKKFSIHGRLSPCACMPSPYKARCAS